MKFPIKIEIDNISELGIDRIVGGSMAYEITKGSTSCC